MMVAAAVAYAKEALLEDGGIGWKEDEKRMTLRSGDHCAGGAGACGRHSWKWKAERRARWHRRKNAGRNLFYIQREEDACKRKEAVYIVSEYFYRTRSFWINGSGE